MDPTTHRLIAAAGSGQIRDANFKNTVLLLHGDGTNGAQNNTFIDGSTNNFTITRNGNTTQGSFNPYGDRWSNYFDGTTDHLQISRTTSLLPGANTDFSVEAWVYLASYNAQNSFICGYYNRTVASDWEFQITSTGVLFIYFANGNITVNSGANTVGLNQWVHVAACRSGTGSNNVKLYINGVERGSGTTNNSTSNGTALNFTIGGDTGGDGNMLFGYISNLRVVNGTAAYTSAFTPSTTPLTAITNTSLLTCQSNRFIDNSATPKTLTRNGDVRVTNFNPFGLASAYSTNTDGGSGYFGGSGNRISFPTGQTPLLLSNSDFTFETFIYRLDTANACILQGQADLNTAAGSSYVFNVGGLSSDIYTGGSTGYGLTSPNPPAGQWVHVAWVRTGSTWSSYLNGSRVGTVNVSTSTINNGSTTYPPTIGGYATGANAFNGYISSVRLIKGSGGYDATQTTITPPTAPLTAITNTSLLLNFTNAGIYDQTEQNVLETVGNAQISTTQKKFGTGALYFDGNGDGLNFPANDALEFRTGNFTIEAWIYPIAVTGAERALLRFESPAPLSTLAFNTNGKIFWYNATESTVLTSATTFSANTWYHIALVRSGTGGSQTVLYVNGVSDATGTSSVSYACNLLSIGNSRTGNTYPFNGYIDDLRITKGVARTITVPTAPYPDF